VKEIDKCVISGIANYFREGGGSEYDIPA